MYDLAFLKGVKSRDAKPACPWSPPRGSFARRPRCSSFRRWLRDAVGLDCPSRSGSVRSGSFLSVCLRVSSVCLRFRSRVGCGLAGGRSSWRTSDQPPPGFSPAPVLMGSQPPVPSSSPRLRRVAFSFFFLLSPHSLIMTCLGVDFFVLILLGICRTCVC